MNTLTGIEAERVNQILKYAIDRLLILSYIPLTWNDDVVVGIKCQPVLNSLEKLWMSEEQIKELGVEVSEEGSNLEGIIGNNQVNTGGRDITLMKQMHRSARNACRNFAADRESLQVLMNRPELQSEDFTKFIKVF